MGAPVGTCSVMATKLRQGRRSEDEKGGMRCVQNTFDFCLFWSLCFVVFFFSLLLRCSSGTLLLRCSSGTLLLRCSSGTRDASTRMGEDYNFTRMGEGYAPTHRGEPHAFTRMGKAKARNKCKGPLRLRTGAGDFHSPIG